MRLPWPFSRPQPSSAVDTTQVFAARPRGPQAWRELPVLATSVGKPPLVAPTPPFRADLAGAAAAPIALAPLTHGRSLDAPKGLVSNIVQAAPAHAVASADHDTASAPLAARRRRGASETQLPDSVAAGDPEPPATVAAGANSAQRAPDTAPLIQRAPVVVRPAPAGASLVSAAGQPALTLPPGGVFGRPAPASHLQRSPAASAASAAPATPATPTTPVPTVAPSRADTPSARVTHSVTRDLAAETTPARPTNERLTLGQARRLGLGAPIDPVAFRVARSQPATDLVLPAPVEKPAPSPAEAQPMAPATTVAASDGPGPGHATQARPLLPSHAPRPAPSPAVARAVPPAAARPAARSAEPARPVPARSRVQRAPRAEAPAEMPPLPIVGARPIVPGVQLAPNSARPGPSADGAALPATDPAGSAAAGSVRIHRGPEASELAGAMDARAFTSGTDVYLPASHGPLSGQKAQSLLAHELTHVSQQRRLGSSLPAEDSALGQQLEAQAVAAERGGGQLPLAARTEQSSDSAPQDNVVALSWSMGSAPAGAPATPSPAASTSAPAAQRAPDAQFSDPDDAFRAKLDSNEAYMFERFERRLRRMLISERERGGTLIDAL